MPNAVEDSAERVAAMPSCFVPTQWWHHSTRGAPRPRW